MTFLKLPLVFTALACSFLGSFIMIKLRAPQADPDYFPFDIQMFDIRNSIVQKLRRFLPRRMTGVVA